MTTPRLVLATVGFEQAAALPLRRAIERLADAAELITEWRRIPGPAVLAEDASVGEALDGADVLLTSTADPRVCGRLVELIMERPGLAVVPLLLADQELLGRTRLGEFAPAERPAETRESIMAAAGALATAGAAVPAELGPVLRASAALAHRLPAGDLRTLGLVIMSFRQLSTGNLVLALRLLARRTGTARGPVDDLGVPELQPEHGLWHPAGTLPGRGTPVIVVACSRNLLFSGNDGHLRALFDRVEQAGHRAVGWFGSTADLAADLEPYADGIRLWINTRGFTLSGRHGTPELAEGLAALVGADVPMIAAITLSNQTLQEWLADATGLSQTTVAMQLAVPELQGGIAPLVIAGRDAATDELVAVDDQLDRLVRLADRLIRLRAKPVSERRIAVILVSHAPEKGAIGAAASLDVWSSLHSLLGALAGSGYRVDVPADAEATFDAVVDRAAPATARVLARYHAADYLREYRAGRRITAAWGPAPGEFDNDGEAFEVHGARLGNVTVCFQPSRGYGADPAGLLAKPDATPTHAFAACYTWLDRHLDPDLVLHFGTHGALEFMPGKQTGLVRTDFSDHLLDAIPHSYLYVASNPSEAAIAKRRSAATIVNHLSPPLADADLDGRLRSLRDDIAGCLAAAPALRAQRLTMITETAEAEGLHHDVDAELATTDPAVYLERLAATLDEVAETLISVGLHRLGRGLEPEDTRAILRACCDQGCDERGLASLIDEPDRAQQLVDAVIAGRSGDDLDPGWLAYLTETMIKLGRNDELGALLHTLDGGFIAPGPGGDPIREPNVLPTGRNTYAIDPTTIPTAAAVRRGRDSAQALLNKITDTGELPESVALVIWGIETIKSRGETLGQAFALLGVEPYADSHGRVNRFRILDPEALGRPRIDVVLTASGVFRDLFGQAMGLLDEAIRAVAVLDEDPERNYVRKHALEQARELGIEVADAATRVFSNAPGDYGSGVNHVVDASTWETDLDLGELYTKRQSYAYGVSLTGAEAGRLFRSVLATVDVTFQNLDSAERSLADSDHYFEYLGGVSAAVKAAGGRAPRVLVSDTYSPRARVRDIDEALRLESRTRLLNPRWYEAMLEHGFQGVREVAQRLDNTFGWSATVDAVDDWIYSAAAATFLFDDRLRDRMAAVNPAAVRSMALRLDEADRRGLWRPSPAERARLDQVTDLLEDAVEGVGPSAA
ncbi:cobaltochelatase subunit CobN [Microlunatus parietis]|uniref:Magnesium chelatase subunit H n=1 Tax=Microlunatus parietis TaxID=682979 RepID=A0A7Y9LBB0_9ACTN|nr:cobaltochelatase subunit CobN [Microlunatus parietis]NYE73709.1 magnesium chelatase subunit H [Microlunatus parietis]